MKKIALCIAALVSTGVVGSAFAGIPAAHVYHNHMPNFWPFYGVDVQATYNATAVGAPVRYMYDGQVINLKNNPPAGYSYYLPKALGGAIMPHDDLPGGKYYNQDAKKGAYFSWPIDAAKNTQSHSSGTGQVHVTMSGAVVNNVNSLVTLKNVDGYTNEAWGQPWTTTYNGLKTTGGNRTLDLIHFTGHHSMGPLVGSDYFAKELIFHGATLSQSYFLGSSYKSSKGFFPTELGFSDRLIPVLAKFGIKWSVIGNNHFSRTLQDYPFARFDPTGDTLVSPPNRADLRNTSSVGDWVAMGMAHEKQTIVNKFPFASTPHWVRYVNPASGEANQIAGIPVSQNGSWFEGWEGYSAVDGDGGSSSENLTTYAATEPRQFYVVAHDGDNGDGRAGSWGTWDAGYSRTCTGNGYCLGIDEYLAKFPIPASDVQHVQDGSWVDTRDSSSDPTWYHWHLPFMIWQGQFADFNKATGMNLAPKLNLNQQKEGATVSFEYGWHYLERNFALLQAAQNYAKTAEQIWLDAHPNYWSPTTDADKQITYSGNQLNPWMMSFPVKGDAANDYKGGANPAELGWYFLLPAMDSGFGYYDENKDDDVKPTLAFNNSLAFTKPYVTTNLAKDKTGPSVWWPQRYPYNPGSVNGSKAEGWTIQHYSKDFAIYTYAYDVSGIASIEVKIRPHTSKTILASDDTYKVYDPAAMVGKAGLNINPAKVGAWKTYPMTVRDLKPVMNGVDWNANVKATLAVVPAQEIGSLCYSYISDYRDQIVDYYIEATDTKGNVTRSEIQQVYVGAGTYTKSSTVGSGFVEDINGTVQGVYPFLVIDNEAPTVPGKPVAGTVTDASVTLSWDASTDNIGVTGYTIYQNGTKVGSSATNSYTVNGLAAQTAYSFSVAAYDAANNASAQGGTVSVTTKAPDTVPPSAPTNLTSSGVTASSVTLGWTASTDNYSVSYYEIDRDGVKVGTSTTTSYTDTTAQPSTTYTYTVFAFDAAGNKSLVSNSLPVTTDKGNIATVYYKVPTGWTTVDIHYAPTGGTWTTAPGVAMKAACTGWTVYTANLGAATGLTATFNNGSGTWDNNGGKNYTLTTGTSQVSGGAVTTGSSPCDDTQAPTVPTGLVSSNVTTSSVTLGWTASTDNLAVTGYNVLRDGVKLGTATTLGYTDSTVKAGTTYNYTVQAYDAAGNTSASSTALPVTTTKIDTQAPTAPTAPVASDVTATSVSLSWTASTDDVGVVSYDIFRDGVKVGNSKTTTYADSGLASGTVYSYTFIAYDAAGNKSPVSVTLPVATTKIDTQAPTAPTVPVASNVGTTSVTLSWTASTDDVGVVSYDIVRDGVKVGSSKTTTYADSGLAAGTSYNYTFYAYDAAGNKSPVSTTLPVTTRKGDEQAPTAPSAPVATSVTPSSVAMSWTASTDNVGVTHYEVDRNGVKVGAPTTTSYTDTSVAPGTSYTYTFYAFDAAGNKSPVSPTLPVTTPVGNTATVYYKVPSGWSTVDIHYGVNNIWTTAPGVAMAAACTGWASYTIGLGTQTSAIVTFNNGSGTWDSNGGKNYTVGTGNSSVSGGVVTAGNNPCAADTEAPSVPVGLATTEVTSKSVKLSWTASTDNRGVTGYNVLRDGVKIGTSTSTSYTDTTVAGKTTYSYSVQAYDAVPNTSAAGSALSVMTPDDSCTTVNVTFTIANAATVWGQNLYVVGNQTNLGNWTPAKGFALAIQGSGANMPWTGTVALPPATSVQYKYVKWNGSTAVWESNQATASGNRVITTPACGATGNQNDGSFKK